MPKEKKTYRFSESVLEIIENRDRKKYPSANEFVERTILESKDKCTLENLETEVKKLQKHCENLEEMMKNILQSMDYPMTTL